MPPSDDIGVQRHRKKQLAKLTDEVGIYALCDLDEVPIYVGKSTDGIRTRVRRHLTSARSDVIANRLVDVWEIAYVWGWPISKGRAKKLEAYLFHQFNPQSTLMTGQIPPDPGDLDFGIPQKKRVQIMTDEEIEARRDPAYRLPRQAEHFVALVDHILKVKDNPQLRRSLVAHFDRLAKYYNGFLRV